MVDFITAAKVVYDYEANNQTKLHNDYYNNNKTMKLPTKKHFTRNDNLLSLLPMPIILCTSLGFAFGTVQF